VLDHGHRYRANVLQRFDVLCVSLAYDSPSSVGALAGNYTLAFSPASNMLNVNSNGVVFAMYDHAWRCTVNGHFSVIDTRFNLYRAASAAEGKPVTTPMVTPAESVRGVVDFILGLDADKSGRCFSHTGAEIPWSVRV
jgi:hypothetical protein